MIARGARKTPKLGRQGDGGIDGPTIIGTMGRHTPEERIAEAVLSRALRDCCSVTIQYVPEIHDDGTPVLTIRGQPKKRMVTVLTANESTDALAVGARKFLTTTNDTLAFWCGILHVAPSRIFEAYWALGREAPADAAPPPVKRRLR